MNLRIDLLAAAVILAGATTLGGPTPAHATYLNPLEVAARSGSGGVIYCCKTSPTAECCSNTGCATRDGFCISVG